MLRSLLFCVLLGTCTIYYFKPQIRQSMSALLPSSSDLTAWRTRAQSHPYPDSYSPARANLALVVLRNSQVEHFDFTLAVFKDKVAIDANGNVLVLSEEDYANMMALAYQALDLPDTGSFGNTWRIEHPVIGKPIDRLLVAVGTDMKEVGVQGYDKEKKVLKNPVGDITELPSILSDLMEIVMKGRDGYTFYRNQVDPETVQKVKSIVAQT
ncbi:uncharacterized protein BT62DRAFT_931318 [Guyanagaster necrorhizus]|uniref:Uncharacterized protein n=1 Tax=Guyanagaster necrorhizus TaxID=856835 RepID=A0A9P7VUK8_9AGAR|nr:uncharacterized protein BT62DRAFT_931318 [Guyanagaster necrorhizus MCA 3950]KAG7446745.1 hypothetical protein BT62DRAFT_931318 [Guyanagaster necrorhizus MCA 3950]